MYLDIKTEGVTLRLPDVTTDLYASYSQRLLPETIAGILAENDAGELLPDGAHVMIPVATLRRLAEGRVSEGWDAEFDKMISYAGTKGWLSDDGTAVRAHLEREL